MRILVVNAGSSSLKLRLLGEDDALLAAEDLESPAEDGFEAATAAIGAFGTIDAVGHRIVHGGVEFAGPVLVEPTVVRRLEALTALAPLHQPVGLAALGVVSRALPRVPAVACFDTAFHSAMPPGAATYALPSAWRDRWPLRRFGFHGLAHAYSARRAAELVRRPLGDLRIVTAHLGAGASLAAVRGGRSVDTTMGFTPLEGLVMATRSGNVDPGLILWLLSQPDLSTGEVSEALEKRSGLLGLAGSADMRAVLEAERAGEPAAALALVVYVHRLRAGIAAMAAAMGGIDVLAFTGGIGENAAPIRARAAEGLGFLGVAVDPARNESVQLDRLISPDAAPVTSLVIRSREELEIARQVRETLQGHPEP